MCIERAHPGSRLKEKTKTDSWSSLLTIEDGVNDDGRVGRALSLTCFVISFQMFSFCSHEVFVVITWETWSLCLQWTCICSSAPCLIIIQWTTSIVFHSWGIVKEQGHFKAWMTFISHDNCRTYALRPLALNVVVHVNNITNYTDDIFLSTWRAVPPIMPCGNHSI